MNTSSNINPKSKYIYHAVSIIMMVVFVLLWIFVAYMDYKTVPFAQGMLFGWAMQYALVNFVMFIDRKKLIS